MADFNSKVMWVAKEFTPTTAQAAKGMSHSWYAEADIVNNVGPKQLAKLVEQRTGVRRYEAEATIGALAEIILEECAQSMRVYLATAEGDKFISFQPKVSGKLSDAYVSANSANYEGATVATEDLLTLHPKKVRISATIGIKTSKEFSNGIGIEKAPARVANESASNGGSNQGGGSNPNPDDDTLG